MKARNKIVTLAVATLLVTQSASYLYAPRVLAEENKTEQVTENNSNQEKATEATESKSDVVEKEATTLTNNAVFSVRIGYEFDDGSFDEWQKGTAFLVGKQDLITTQTLADTSTSSNLYKNILQDKGDSYKSAGIDLKDESKTEKHIVVKVVNSEGKEVKVSSNFVKNGLGVLTLEKTEKVTPAVFGEDEKIDTKEGAKYKLKLASYDKSKTNIVESEGSLVKPPAKAAKGVLAMAADTSVGDVLGAPVINNDGVIIGMVTGTGESLTVVPTDALQKFLTSGGVKYTTEQDALKKRKNGSKDDTLENANKATVSTKKLDAVIKKAEAVDKKKYTEESYNTLEKELKSAKKISKDEDSSQAEIDSSEKRLKKAYDGLEEYSLTDKLFEAVSSPIGMGVIGGGIALIGGALTFSKMRKRKGNAIAKAPKGATAKKDDMSDYSSELRRLENQDLMNAGMAQPQPVQQPQPSIPTNQPQQHQQPPVLQQRNAQGEYEDVDYNIDVTDQVAPRGLRTSNTNIPGVNFADESPETPQNLSNQRYGVPMGGANMYDDGEEETTILSSSPTLTRVDDGTSFPIHDNFVIGKERKSTNYCVVGNTSVSRQHAQIRYINGIYHIEDLSSKNYTFLNGNQLPAYRPAELKDGDIIKLSNVEFVFHQ